MARHNRSIRIRHGGRAAQCAAVGLAAARLASRRRTLLNMYWPYAQRKSMFGGNANSQYALCSIMTWPTVVVMKWGVHPPVESNTVSRQYTRWEVVRVLRSHRQTAL